MAQFARGPNHYRGLAIPAALCGVPHRRLADRGQVCYLQFSG